MTQTTHTYVEGWRHDPSLSREQLTHMVPTGRRTALCGASCEVTGGQWSPASQPIARCSMCMQASSLH